MTERRSDVQAGRQSDERLRCDELPCELVDTSYRLGGISLLCPCLRCKLVCALGLHVILGLFLQPHRSLLARLQQGAFRLDLGPDWRRSGLGMLHLGTRRRMTNSQKRLFICQVGSGFRAKGFSYIPMCPRLLT